MWIVILNSLPLRGFHKNLACYQILQLLSLNRSADDSNVVWLAKLRHSKHGQCQCSQSYCYSWIVIIGVFQITSVPLATHILVCFQLPYEIGFEDIRQILYIPCHTQTSIKQRPGLFAICLVLGFSRIGSLLTLSCRKCWQWLNQGTKKTFSSITFNLFCLILGFLVVFFNQFAVCNVYLMAKGFIN